MAARPGRRRGDPEVQPPRRPEIALDDADREAIAALPKGQRCVSPGFAPDWD
jgi:hypothetical protein